MTQPTIRFSVIGVNHSHIYGQVNLLLRAGAELVDFFAPEPNLAAHFARSYPQARQAGSAAEILEDPSVQLIVTAGIPSERAPLGIEAMRHGERRRARGGWGDRPRDSDDRYGSASHEPGSAP